MTILILGGTAEARQLAAALVADGLDVISSLAGRVNSPSLPPGRVRVGGFGGADGLAEYLRGHQVSAVVDATHPFAATISVNALQAANRTSTPLVRLERPGWRGHPRAGSWTWVANGAAARAVAELPQLRFSPQDGSRCQIFIPGPTGMSWSGWSIRRRHHCPSAGS